MGFIKEFKEFAMRGNLIDMAVGVVIGAAFGTVTKSFIEGIFMPIVGLIFQIDDMSNYAFDLGSFIGGKSNKIMVGSFISSVINFVIIAFAMFMVVKGVNVVKRKLDEAPAAPVPPAPPSKEEQLLTEIRDLLKSK